MPNRLAHEPSLYLRQHQDNPVDWYPWGEEAFRRAREADLPVLVSIGYSACHWCHVMAHECFESPYIAGLMNRHFVCIKVDREERPDLDHIYMEAVQMMQGRGGWPLNVFCLPDGRPFAGGTYFPPEDRGNGMIPWPQLLLRVSEFFRQQRDDLVENAKSILGNLKALNHPFPGEGRIGPDLLLTAATDILDSYDPGYGGFGDAPKFPPSMTLDFLLALRRTRSAEERPPLSRRLDQAVHGTLTAMAHGGIFDQVGGGFARYSVDRQWIIPHFEKMLYDNALLLGSFARGWRAFGSPLHRAVCEETVSWMEREMALPNGLFAASLDADSEGHEGRYYVWTPSQVEQVLGQEEGARFCHAYGISEDGNFEHGASNPVLLTPDFAERERFAPARRALLEARRQRPAPTRDPKAIVSWNGFAIRGLSEAGLLLGRPDWVRRAEQAAEALWSMTTSGEARLPAVIYGEAGRGRGSLDDHAAVAEGFLALASAINLCDPQREGVWRERAGALAETVLRRFSDPDRPGFFFTADDHERLPLRRKEWFDQATPSGQSSMLHVASNLYAVTGEDRWGRLLETASYPGILSKAPSAVSHALTAFTENAMGIAVIKGGTGSSWEALLAALQPSPWRRTVLVNSTELPPGRFQLCVGPSCQLPEADPEAIAELW